MWGAGAGAGDGRGSGRGHEWTVCVGGEEGDGSGDHGDRFACFQETGDREAAAISGDDILAGAGGAGVERVGWGWGEKGEG